MKWTEWAEAATQFLEWIALVVILLGIAWSFAHATWRYWRDERAELYARFRGDLARSILVGLELLVGADIVRTVGRAPDFYELGTLAAIVLIRSFLSASMEMELEGRWPWQKKQDTIVHAPPSVRMQRVAHHGAQPEG